MIVQLVMAGLDIDAQDADGETPLLNAIFRGSILAVEKLLELRADPNVCNISSVHLFRRRFRSTRNPAISAQERRGLYRLEHQG